MNLFMTNRRPGTAAKRISRASYVALAMIFALGLTGCAGNPASSARIESYAWSHAMSGDYLFAYDSSACEQSAGSAAAPEFFTCMEQLGYYQIDPVSGVRVTAVTPQEQAPGVSVVSEARGITSAAR